MLAQVAILLLVLSPVSGCGADEPPTRTRVDVGEGFCLTSSEGNGLTFRMHTGDLCLSACEHHDFTCSATLDARRVEIHSVLESTAIPGVEICPAVCESATATCELELPAPGDYQFGFASRFDTASVPLESSIHLFGDGPCDPSKPQL